MSAASIALAAQARLIEQRRAEAVTELRRHEAECLRCGEGPTDGKELRMCDFAHGWVAPGMVCRDCHKHPEQDFTDLPLVWSPIQDAAR